MNTTPEIETRRLVLRPFHMGDAEDVFAYASNPNVLRYTTGKTPSELAETEAFVRGLVNKPSGAFAWAIRLKNRSCVIGAVEFGMPDGTTGAVDYALAEEYWNKGIMTEAIRAVLAWVFRTHPRLQRVCASAMTINAASIRVMKKCGLEFQKKVQENWEKFPEPVELSVYAIYNVS